MKAQISDNQYRVVNEKWNSLSTDIVRYQENSFYQSDLSLLQSLTGDTKANEDKKTTLLRRLIEEEVTLLLNKEIVTNYPKVMEHLGLVKGLRNIKPLLS